MIAIIDYGAGNVRSVKNALERLGATVQITNNPEVILGAERVVFPGVGQARTAMDALKTTGLHRLIPKLKQPVLGICLGMQLLCEHSEEGNTQGLGIFPVSVKRFPQGKRVPHMGWNTISALKSPLLAGVNSSEDVYFVHSYYAENSPYSIGKGAYDISFSAALQRDNFYAVQFHPEKSAAVGQRILQNFLTL